MKTRKSTLLTETSLDDLPARSAGGDDAAIANFLETDDYTNEVEMDALNRPSKMTMPDGSEQVPSYSRAGFLTKMEVQLAHESSFTEYVSSILYNVRGQRTDIFYGNGSKTAYTYDEANFRLSRLLTTRNTGSDILQDLNYTYDAVGNIVEHKDDAQQTLYFSNTVIEPKGKYVYDALYRLTQATGREKDALAAPSETGYTPDFVATNAKTAPTLSTYCEKYTYDELGNITELSHKDTCDGTENWKRTYVYNSGKPNNYLQSAYTGSTAPSSAQFTYDEHGNLLQMPHLAAMNWDFQDQLQSTDKTDETTYYVYSGGERIRKVVVDTSGTTDKIKYERIYLGGYELYKEYDSSEDLESERTTYHVSDDKKRIASLEVKTRTGGSEITPANQTTITRYQYSNHLDSACLELNENAEILSYEEFHPFGSTSYSMHTNDSEVSLKRYKYNGKERDEESGLDYYGARYYAPWLCRFISVDPLKDQYPFQNSFAYAANSPVTLTDVNGEGPGGGDENDPPPIDSDLAGSPEFENSNDPNNQKHSVKKGDTLSALAEKYGTTVDALRELNPQTQSRKLKDQINIGEELDFTKTITSTDLKPTNNSVYTVTVTDGSYGGSENFSINSNEISDFNKYLAFYLRNSENIGEQPNPFFNAEAIVFDFGGVLSGAERDFGSYFILAGPEAGKWGSFNELAGGGAPEFGLGIEIGRIDITGNTNTITSDLLFGARKKVWLNIGEGVSVGGAFAWGEIKTNEGKRTITSKSLQIGIGLSTFISPGYNKGEIYK